MENKQINRDLPGWIDNHVVRLGQSAIRILDEFAIYIDVFKKNPRTPKADFLFVTHNHGDHFNPDVVQELHKPTTHVIVPESMRRNHQDKGLSTEGIEPGETKTIGSLTVTAIPAYNLKKPMHPRKDGFVGYLITLPNGLKIYHAGDTDFVPEMRGLEADIAFLPVGGLATMNWKEALEAQKAMVAGLTIPIHYGLIPFSVSGARKFLAQGGDRVKELLNLKK